MTMMSGGQVVAHSLVAHGTEVVFGIPGNHNLSIYAHLDSNCIRHVLARHEQGCGYAADGYARASGRPGVALVTAGPAVLNTLASLGQAYSDSLPVLLVAPGMPLRHPALGNGHLHEMKDQQAAVAAVVAASYRVSSVEEIPSAVSQAFAAMTAGRPRPAYLEIPIDVLDEEADVELGQPVTWGPRAASVAEIERAAGLLRSSTHPGIVVGGGARGADSALCCLAERLGATVITSTNGKGTLPEDHPLSLGAGAHLSAAAAWARSRDVLLAVGTDLGSSDLWNGPWDFTGTLIRIDIDPAQMTVNARSGVALVGDAGETMTALASLLGEVAPVPAEATEWRERIGTEGRNEGAMWGKEIAAIASVLERDAIVAGDSAAVCYYGLRTNLPAHSSGSFLYPTGFGTLGYGLPAAIGAKIAYPERQVMAVLGDGGVMFTLAELASAAAEGLPLPVVVVDNGGYGQIRKNMEERGYRPLGVDIPSPDFPAVARALGCHGISIDTPERLAEELAKAFTSDRPTVLHVMEGEHR